MSQRLTMAAAIVMACACVGMFAVMWRSMGTQQRHINALTLQMQQDADEADRQREQLQALLADSQELNRELTETVATQLGEIEERAAETSDWNPVEFRLVQGTEDGPPAVGFRIVMRITTPETGIPSSMGESDEAGVVRFERVRYGRYDVDIISPWNEYCYRRISLQPGESHTATIVCPTAAPEPLEALLVVDWPEDLADRPILMQVDPWGAYRVVESEFWSTTGNAVRRGGQGERFRWADVGPRSVFVAPSRVIHYEERRGFERHLQLFVAAADGHSPVRAMRWPGEDYAVPKVEFYVALSAEEQTADAEVLPKDSRLWPVNAATIERGALQWRVEQGSPDRIVILPPEHVVSAMREFLEAQPTSTASARGLTRLPAALMTTDLTRPAD